MPVIPNVSSAVDESSSALRAFWSWSHNRSVWVMLAMLLFSSLLSATRSKFPFRILTKMVFCGCSYTISPTLLAGRNL